MKAFSCESSETQEGGEWRGGGDLVGSERVHDCPHRCEHLTLLRGQKISEEKKHGSRPAVTARVTKRDLDGILITPWKNRKASKGV